MTERERLTLEPIADEPEVGRWLSALEDGRRDTLVELDGVTDAIVDERPPGSENSIGSALYHWRWSRPTGCSTTSSAARSRDPSWSRCSRSTPATPTGG